MKKNWTYIIFILFLIFVISLIVINIHREEKFVPSNYVDISSNIITNLSDPSQCFNSCDVNPSCDGVSIIQNKKTDMERAGAIRNVGRRRASELSRCAPHIEGV